MQVIFVNKLGKTFAPLYYTVYYKRNGNSFKRLEATLNLYKFAENNDLVKIELYENGTAKTSPVLKDKLCREEYACMLQG